MAGPDQLVLLDYCEKFPCVWALGLKCLSISANIHIWQLYRKEDYMGLVLSYLGINLMLLLHQTLSSLTTAACAILGGIIFFLNAKLY